MHMRILFTSVLALMVSLVAFSWTHAAPQWVPLGSDFQEEVTVDLLESSESRMVVEFRLDGYLLDEVDQNLDAINAENVAKMVKRNSDHAQFLQISLRKVTLKEAEHLVGVTMQKKGISDLVMKVDLGDVKEPPTPEGS